MSRFSRWAGRKTPLIETPTPAPSAAVQPHPQVMVPLSYGQPLIQHTPGFRAPVTLYPSQVYLGDVPQTDLLMGQDTSHVHAYESLLGQLPELAPKAATEATDMPGFPDGQVTDKWSPTTRYRNGATDQSALPRFLDYVRGKYRATGAAIRSAAGMKVSTGRG